MRLGALQTATRILKGPISIPSLHARPLKHAMTRKLGGLRGAKRGVLHVEAAQSGNNDLLGMVEYGLVGNRDR